MPRTDLLRLAAAVDGVLLLAAAALVVFYAPPDAVEGIVQKIFYLHVPAAIAAYMSFAVVLVGGFVYLWNESPTASAAGLFLWRHFVWRWTRATRKNRPRM